MQKLNTLFKILFGLTLLSCSSDINENNNSQKMLTQITYNYLDGQNRLTQNLVYDTNDNLIEINDANGLVASSYSYNSSNFLIKVVDFQYNDDNTFFEIIKNISYNDDNKITNIEELFNVYNVDDGSFNYQNTSNRQITYGNNAITISIDGFYRTIEFTLSNNLITGVKIFKDGNLESDMLFSYDNEGNCIAGSGPYEPRLYSTTDIDLSVVYGNEEKDPYFNAFFDFNVLFHNSSFFQLKEVLINQQGKRYPERIQWYQFEDWNNKETNDYSFDNEGYIISKKTNIYNTNTYAEIVRFTWE